MGDGGRKVDIYRGKDPLDLPAYSLVECAHFLQVPAATVRTWALGRHYPAGTQRRFWRPLIEITDPDTPALSFRNAIELHVLAAMRRKHKIEMRAVRRAVEYLSHRLGISHPLADQQMLTDGTALFIEHLGRLVNISQDGQLEMRTLIEVYLRRIDRDKAGLPVRLFPFTRSTIEDSPKLIVLDPRIQFGRPCIAGTGIPTSIIAERYRHCRKVQGRREHRRPRKGLWAKISPHSRSDPIRVRCNGCMNPSFSFSTVAWKASSADTRRAIIHPYRREDDRPTNGRRFHSSDQPHLPDRRERKAPLHRGGHQGRRKGAGNRREIGDSQLFSGTCGCHCWLVRQWRLAIGSWHEMASKTSKRGRLGSSVGSQQMVYLLAIADATDY